MEPRSSIKYSQSFFKVMHINVKGPIILKSEAVKEIKDMQTKKAKKMKIYQ
jgi:hypothetical protein